MMYALGEQSSSKTVIIIPSHQYTAMTVIDP